MIDETRVKTTHDHVERERQERWLQEASEHWRQSASRAGKASWATMTPEQRRAKMKRRAANRKKK